jgi:tRNA(Ile)-lysidine synthase
MMFAQQSVAQGEASLAAPVENLVNSLITAQARYELFPPGADGKPTPVVIGVSGGLDSVCLLHALLHLAERWRLRLYVAHLDHALRPESVADAEFVTELATTWELPYFTERLPTGQLEHQPDGVEAAARRARYAFLSRIASNVTPPGKVPIIAVAHHADDQAETVLLHLVRGSGLRGLGAMRWVTTLQTEAGCVQLVRPLLAVRRLQLLAYAGEQGLPWREDATNSDPRFVRNRIRQEVMPLLAELNPNIVQTLGRTASLLADEAARLSRLDAQHLQEVRLDSGLDSGAVTERIVLDLAALLRRDLATQRAVLRQALAELSGGAHDLQFDMIERILVAIKLSLHSSGPHPLLGEMGWTLAGGAGGHPARLSLHRMEALPFAPDYPWLDAEWRSRIRSASVPENGVLATPQGWTLCSERFAVADLPAEWRTQSHPWVIYCDAEQLGSLTLTTPRPGLRIASLGMGGRRQLLGDLFTNRKIPVALRAGWPLLIDTARGEVMWVCGLALADAVKITERTTKAAALHWRSQSEPRCAPM